MSPQHEKSAVLAAFKLIALAMLLGAIGGLVYYGLELREDGVEESKSQESGDGDDVSQSSDEEEVVEDVSVDEDGDGWVAYENETLDLSFEYPVAWGAIEEEREEGTFGDWETDENGIVFECETQTWLKIGEERQEKIFLAADDSAGCEPLGRGGYWGDQSARVSSVDEFESLCASIERGVCGPPKTNAKGVRYIRVHYDQIESWGEIITDVDEYYFFNEGHDWDSVIISDEGFNGEGDAEFEQLVESLEFQQ